MLEQIGSRKPLYQEDAAWAISKRFGSTFVYANTNGNPAIAKPVLKAFRELSGESVVWERGERCWRQRRSDDATGRQQD
jgi:hypothetical protein